MDEAGRWGSPLFLRSQAFLARSCVFCQAFLQSQEFFDPSDNKGAEFLQTQEFTMLVKITSPTELGLVVRATRRAAGVRIDDAAATAGLSKQFTSDVERGKETVQFGLVLQLLRELGVELRADIPNEAAVLFHSSEFRATVKPARPRRAAPTSGLKAKPPRKGEA